VSKSQRDKGARRERQIVDLHTEIGVKAERVPLSGAMKFRNTEKSDVDVYARGKDAAPFVTEVKARANGEGFVTLERWLGMNDVLFLMRDRAKPLVVLPWERWAELMAR
jgi:Holliday junction resolvase